MTVTTWKFYGTDIQVQIPEKRSGTANTQIGPGFRDSTSCEASQYTDIHNCERLSSIIGGRIGAPLIRHVARTGLGCHLVELRPGDKIIADPLRRSVDPMPPTESERLRREYEAGAEVATVSVRMLGDQRRFGSNVSSHP